jgi:hypothetical protein
MGTVLGGFKGFHAVVLLLRGEVLHVLRHEKSFTIFCIFAPAVGTDALAERKASGETYKRR